MTRDLTVGKPAAALLRLSLPMFVSVIFQQLYNIADSIIAGQFAGEGALAAVGASYPITMVFMSVAFGFNIGCSVVISQLFGAKELRDTKTAVSTSLLTSLGLAAVFTAVGAPLSGHVMRLIGTPSDILADGTLYLQIFTGGLVFLFLYNAVTAVFTALGDTRTPLYFLIGSSLFNILLDYLLVAHAHMGVAGVAWATFIAQGIAGVLSAVALLITLKKIKTEKYKKFSRRMVFKIARYAMPSILQQCFISVGNICVQSVVNRYGSAVVAGFSAGTKLNAFAVMCMVNMSNGMSTYTAQNCGAGDYGRVRSAYKWGLLFMGLICLPFVFTFVFGGDIMMKLFVFDISAEAMKTGVLMLKIISPFYFLAGIKMISDGVTRGGGAMTMFMLSTLSDLIIRVALSYILAPTMGVLAVYWSWPIGWGVGMIIAVAFYLSGKWKGKSVATKKELDGRRDNTLTEKIVA